MRGPVNTKIKLKIMRKGRTTWSSFRRSPAMSSGSSRFARIPRATISAISASPSSTSKPPTAWKSAIADLSAQDGDKIKGFILDLRTTRAACSTRRISVSNAFLNRGEIVSTPWPQCGSVTQRFTARPGDLTKGKPVIVPSTAARPRPPRSWPVPCRTTSVRSWSAMRSFGKGACRPSPCSARHRLEALQPTTARYFTPSGRARSRPRASCPTSRCCRTCRKSSRRAPIPPAKRPYAATSRPKADKADRSQSCVPPDPKKNDKHPAPGGGSRCAARRPIRPSRRSPTRRLRTDGFRSGLIGR